MCISLGLCSQTLVLAIWYANPQRLDVYSNGVYILPNNAEYVNGKLQYRQSQTVDEFKPAVSSMINGENYFDRDTQSLYLVLRGASIIEIKTTPVVIVSFGVPAVEADEFFEVNLVSNLAALLQISEEKIRVVEIIREDSRKRRRRAADEVEVVLEIGNQISPNSSINGTEATAAPGGNAFSFNPNCTGVTWPLG